MARAPKAEDDLITRLASRGEEALHRVAELPGGSRALRTIAELRLRVDELTKKVRGVEKLEARLAALEKKVASLERARKKDAASPRT
ncbi:MAG: hypothetical protein ACKVUT_07810 [Gaiella sp.]